MARGGDRYKGGKRKLREQKTAFHILCEGENTEPSYFKAFPISNLAHCKGYARSKMPLVNEAIKYKNRKGISNRTKDEVWVVFDYDYDGNLQPGQKADFNNSIDRAIANNIKVAVSNDSFELWFLLHFENCNAEEGREWYNNRLTSKLPFKYGKELEVAKQMYDLLKPNQNDAIQRAHMLFNQYSVDDKSHADKNPYTSVHFLVLELNKYIR